MRKSHTSALILAMNRLADRLQIDWPSLCARADPLRLLDRAQSSRSRTHQNSFEDQTMSVVTELFEFLLIHLPFLTAHAYAHALA